MTKLELKVKTNKLDKVNEVTLDVEAPTEIAEKAYAIACRDISNNVDIPGFRKGKAPRDIIEKNYGKAYISQKAFENVFYDMLFKAASQEKIEIVDVVEISSFNLLPSQPLTFKAVVELKPDVKLGKYKGLKVAGKKMEYDQDDFIKQTLEKISNNLITFKVVEREITEGDLITIDFEGKFEDGSEVPGGQAEKFQAVLEKGRFIPEFIDKLQGVKAGESKDIEVKFPENYDKGFAGKLGKFHIKVHTVEEKVLPEINDELAKKVGVESLALLKEKIVKQMTEMQEINNKNEFENKLVEEIIKNSTFDVSERMLQREVEHLLHDVKHECEHSGLNWDEFKKDEKNKDIFDRANETAKKRISIDLVLSAVIRTENIIAKPEEIEQEIKMRIAQNPEGLKHVEQDVRFKSAVHLSIVRNKALDFLVHNNEPVWGKDVNVVSAGEPKADKSEKIAKTGKSKK